MFNPSNRRYTGAKTKLLAHIDESLKQCFDYERCENLSFFDVFAGTGVVSHYFMQKKQFKSFYLNDFLYSNFAIYQGFFSDEGFDLNKLLAIKKDFLRLDSKALQENYYSLNFGDKFFSNDDCKLMGFLREEIERLLESKRINQKEYYILLSSLLYSVDKIANTVGHYDAYRKKERLQNRLEFELINPCKGMNARIYREDSNVLAKQLAAQNVELDVCFIDPPYNSRQYSRFYHLLENLTQNTKPPLYGIALKPQPQNLSLYCTNKAEESFKDLIHSLSQITKVLVVTYNNTSSANARSNTKISLEGIAKILESKGKTRLFSFAHSPFSSGKTDKYTSFKEHRECVFVCCVGRRVGSMISLKPPKILLKLS